ncbi:MAG: hypothetical protein FIB00_09385 [Chloroflexi bacterium]|nr:hypothetical protein [Chloroflexota bacterium]PWB45762.1 MAG: hypothetical protein C3F10_05560 [Dehalococcoidia bacterium]
MTTLAADLLNWLTWLPFLAVDDLALLTGSPAPDVEAALRELARAGHVDSITPSSPELERSRLYILTEPIRRQLAVESQGSEQQSALPLESRDILRRLASLEATVALNVFAVGLVASLRRDPKAEIEDIWALPTRRPTTAWWPPGVHAFGSVRIGGAGTPFFVVVDRAGAPSAHRAALVAGWYRFREGPQPWGTDCLPLTLILCPGPAWEDAWAQHVLASADRRRLPPLPVLLAGRAGFGDGPDGPHWRRADGAGQATLAERFRVEPTRAAYHPPRPGRLPNCPPDATDRATPLHRWAQETARDSRNASRLELLAALSLTTSEIKKRLLDCLGGHPLLTEPEMATVLGVQPRVVRIAIDRAVRNRLIAVYDRANTPSPYYCLTRTGLELLAMRDGVPPRRYARHTALTALPAGDSRPLPTLLQQFEHTVGANSFFIAWLDCTGGLPRLLSWLSAAEAAIRFESGGRRRSLRPDGAGALLIGDRRFPFLLEWDRGTERPPVLAEKLARYEEFFRSRATAANEPTVLFVTNTPQREELVRKLATAILRQHRARLLTTTASILERFGPRASIWRAGTSEPRTSWPDPGATERNPLEVPG